MATQIPPDGDIMKPANVDVSRYRSKDPMMKLNHSRNPRPLHPGNVGPSSRDPRGSFDIACGMDFYNLFYDTWVARDHLGGNFLPYMPYSDNPTMRSAIARILSGASSEGAEKSTGVFVKSCWNGLGAIRGRLFLPQRGLGVLSEKAASPPRIPPTDSVSATSEVELNEPKGPDEASALRAAKTSLSPPADAPSVGEIDSLATLLNPLLTFAPQAKSPLEQDLFFYTPRRLLCRVLRCDGGDAQGFPAYSTPWWEFHLNAYLNEGTAPQDLPRDIDHPLMASREDSFIPPFRLKVLQVYEHGLCLKVPYITDALSRSPLLQSFRMPSGVIFDRIGKSYSEAPGSR
ncbi:unnamed protein product [Phytomonas sp. EM1]|nr:unnamed protein product [Phytomonas sp. EM1]|eukprot:CCW61844.1 unnamed protein product [Phytomonas sp. isolate EM1]